MEINQESYLALVKTVNETAETVAKLQRFIAAHKIDSNQHLKKNPDIQAGSATKVTYDEHGLIRKGDHLTEQDIPNISMSKVSHLEETLQDIRSAIPTIDPIKRSSRVAGTAVKVNYDENGFIIDGAELLETDIPQLSIQKIDGLQDTLDDIQSLISTYHEKHDTSDIIRQAVVPRSTAITMDDLPSEINYRITFLESILPDLATGAALNTIAAVLKNKLDDNVISTPGTYTKVTINEHGQVQLGDHLKKEDLPSIGIDDISSLRESLNHTASIEQLNEIQSTISIIESSLSKIPQAMRMESLLKEKVGQDEFDKLKLHVETLHLGQPGLEESVVMEEIQKMKDKISSLEDIVLALKRNLES